MDSYKGAATGGDNSFSEKERISILREEYFSRLIEFLPIVFYTCDEYGRLTFYNKAAVSYWGFKPELGKDFYHTGWKLYSIEGKPLAIDAAPMALTLKHAKPHSGEIILENEGGQRLYIQSTPKPIFNTSGKLVGALNTHVDISQRYILKQKADEAEEKQQLDKKRMELQYQQMIEEIEDYAIIMLDIDGKIVSWNKGAEKIKGYKNYEIIGKNFKNFYFKQDREDKLPDRLLKTAHNEGRACHEGWRRRKDDSRFWGSIVITAIHDEKGKVIGYTKVTRDLTEIKLADDRINEYNRKLEAKNKELEQYAYVASHDLQEPLRKIEFFSRMLKDKIDEKEDALLYADKISGATQRMSKLIKDILQYTDTNSDELISETDVNAVISNVIFDLELIINEKNAQVNFDELPKIKAIPVQIYQLFHNILSNSLKFSECTPQIEITYCKASEEEVSNNDFLITGDEYIKFRIKDNGIGFDPIYKNKIFEMFERLGSQKGGTGIGLALCRKIVRNHKGYITASSEENNGTEIIVYLPKVMRTIEKP